MAAACPLGDQSCPYDPRTQRHRHTSPDLQAIGERCTCRANAWLITFGGLLPARIVCGSCGEGFNIGQRLRDCGKPASATYRSNR